MSLPMAVQKEVRTFCQFHQKWLAEILREGKARSDFAFTSDPLGMSKAIFSALQGALIIARGQNGSNHFRGVVKVLKEIIKPSGV